MLLWILFIGDVEDSSGRRAGDRGPLLVGIDHRSLEKTTMSDPVGRTPRHGQRHPPAWAHAGRPWRSEATVRVTTAARCRATLQLSHLASGPGPLYARSCSGAALARRRSGFRRRDTLARRRSGFQRRDREEESGGAMARRSPAARDGVAGGGGALEVET